MARALIESRAGEWQPAQYENRAQSALMKVIEEKIQNRPYTAKLPSQKAARDVVGLLAVLKGSLEGNCDARKRPGKSAFRPTLRRVERRPTRRLQSRGAGRLHNHRHLRRRKRSVENRASKPGYPRFARRARASHACDDSPIENRRQVLTDLFEQAAGPLRLSPLLEAPTRQILGAIRLSVVKRIALVNALLRNLTNWHPATNERGDGFDIQRDERKRSPKEAPAR